MQVTFLLGAGVSVAVGMPSTQEITETILTGKAFVRGLDASVAYDPNNRIPDGPHVRWRSEMRQPIEEWRKYLSAIRNRMQALAPRADSFYTYEEIYHVAEMLANGLRGEPKDPLAVMFWEGLDNEVRGWLENRTGFVEEACSRMVQTVGTFLTERQKQVVLDERLRLIADAARDPDVEKLHIHTLNHDTIVEEYLRQQKISVFDGFGDPDGDFRWLGVSGYAARREDRVVLLKLHGSCDWFCWHFSGMPPCLGKAAAGISDKPKDRGGRYWHTLPIGPRILVGTVNKAQSYQEAPFPQLFCQFQSQLATTSTLVVCGHSFCDDGIRSHLENWAWAAPRRRILLVSRSANEVLRRNVSLRLRPFVTPRDACIESMPWQEVRNWLRMEESS